MRKFVLVEVMAPKENGHWLAPAGTGTDSDEIVSAK